MPSSGAFLNTSFLMCNLLRPLFNHSSGYLYHSVQDKLHGKPYTLAVCVSVVILICQIQQEPAIACQQILVVGTVTEYQLCLDTLVRYPKVTQSIHSHFSSDTSGFGDCSYNDGRQLIIRVRYVNFVIPQFLY